MKRRWIWMSGILLSTYVSAGSWLTPGASSLSAAERNYETPPVLEASEVLPATMQAGSHFKVNAAVQNDGVMNHYTVASDYGKFETYGDIALARLIREIDAIAQLGEVSKSKEFLKSAELATTAQLKTIKTFAVQPVDTVQGIPGGVKHMFRKYKRQTREGYQAAKDVGSQALDAVTPGEDESNGGTSGEAGDTAELTDQATDAATSYAKKYLGVTGAERQWYKKLGVDPYTQNAVLKQEVHRMAKVDAAAKFGVNLAPIPSIPGVSTIKHVNEAVWDADPAELHAHNLEELQTAGVDETLIENFMDNKFLSPSQRTMMLSTLTRMKGVDGLEVLLQTAAEADSTELAEFNLVNTLLLEGYHRTELPVAKVLVGEPVPVAMTSEGGLIILVSADYAFWDEDLGEVISIMAGRFADQEAGSREMWLRGKASARFVNEVGGLGWVVRQNVGVADAVEEQFAAPPGQ